MSAPQFQSAEVGNVDATTVVVTFDQAVTVSDVEDDGSMKVSIPARGGYAVPDPGWAGRGR